jgi:ABC-type nitrate/sulfonate/bicarbonate transport system substrate-binding protein
MSKSRVKPKGELMMKQPVKFSMTLSAAVILALLVCAPPQAKAQQKELPEVSMLTAVPNFAFAAIWVAEQLKYFEQEGVRMKITPAPSGSVCLNAVVGRSTNFCASTSEGLVLASRARQRLRFKRTTAP